MKALNFFVRVSTWFIPFFAVWGACKTMGYFWGLILFLPGAFYSYTVLGRDAEKSRDVLERELCSLEKTCRELENELSRTQTDALREASLSESIARLEKENAMLRDLYSENKDLIHYLPKEYLRQRVVLTLYRELAERQSSQG